MSNDEKYSVVYSPVLWGRSVLHGTFSRFLAEPYKTKPCQTADLQGVFFLCRSHAALKDRLPALQACGLIKTPWRDDWQLLFSPPHPHPTPLLPSQIWGISLTGEQTLCGGVSGDALMIRTCGRWTTAKWSCDEGAVHVLGGRWGVKTERTCSVKRGRDRRSDAEWRMISKRWRVL